MVLGISSIKVQFGDNPLWVSRIHINQFHAQSQYWNIGLNFLVVSKNMNISYTWRLSANNMWNYSDRVQGSTPNKPNWTLFYLKFITDNLTSLSLMFEGIFNVSGEILKIKFNISLLLAVLMWIQIAQFNFI